MSQYDAFYPFCWRIKRNFSKSRFVSTYICICSNINTSRTSTFMYKMLWFLNYFHLVLLAKCEEVVIFTDFIWALLFSDGELDIIILANNLLISIGLINSKNWYCSLCINSGKLFSQRPNFLILSQILWCGCFWNL